MVFLKFLMAAIFLTLDLKIEDFVMFSSPNLAKFFTEDRCLPIFEKKIFFCWLLAGVH